VTDWFPWEQAPSAEYAVIGDPIDHSLSPLLHNAALRASGREERYVALQIPQSQFYEALEHLRTLGFRGLNVTTPNKQIAFEWCDERDTVAADARSVNVIDLIRRRGTNTDVPGFLQTLNALNIRPGAHILILGAGGAAQALVSGLTALSFKVSLYNRTQEKAVWMATKFEKLNILVEPNLEGVDLLVDATSSGLHSQIVSLDWRKSDPNLIAYTLAYGKASEGFLRAASEANRRAIDGSDFLIAQAELSFAWWFGESPQAGVMKSALESYLCE